MALSAREGVPGAKEVVVPASNLAEYADYGFDSPWYERGVGLSPCGGVYGYPLVSRLAALMGRQSWVPVVEGSYGVVLCYPVVDWKW